MSYLEELKTRYKEARKRMEKYAIPEPRPVRSLPQPTPPSEQETIRPGLVSEKAESDIVCKALNISSVQNLSQHGQLYKMADELINSPRLPPIPGLVLNEPGAIRWMRILHAVARQHKIQAEEILSTSRKRHILNARFEVFYRLRVDLAMSYTKIGKIFNKDHTTILHGVNKVRQKLLDEIRMLPDDDRSLTVNHSDRGETSPPDNLSAA